MGKKMLKGYRKLLDKQIGNGVSIIVIISLLIVSIGSIAHTENKLYANNNQDIISTID